MYVMGYSLSSEPERVKGASDYKPRSRKDVC